MAQKSWCLADSGYVPRKQFEPLHDRKERWAAVLAHRRAGKTVACVEDLQIGALTCPLREPRFAYVAPTYTQAKDVAWSYAKQYGLTVPGAVANESELRIDYPNGGRVRLYGSDNYDRLRGLYLDGVVLDEYGDMDPRAWPEVIRPALSDRGGWAVFIGTPKGRNHFADICELAKNDPDWLFMRLRASETGILNPYELTDARKTMTEDQYEQEYECSFDAAVLGSYYGKELKTAEADGRISRVPYDPSVPVYTAWDLGIGDSTAIWFAQLVGREVHIIDYYEGSGVALQHYVKVLKEKPYIYDAHYLPHDANARELQTGKSRIEALWTFGIKAQAPRKPSGVEVGIQAVRTLLPRCWFDEKKCERGIAALRNYQREYDDKLKTFKLRPLHDWSSHAADAFRELAMQIKPRYEADPYDPQDPMHTHGQDDDTGY